MKDFTSRIIPMWLWILTIVIFIIVFASKAMAQQARPTFNPFNNGMMIPNQGYYNNNFSFPNNTNHPLNFHRPSNFGFQNNFQRPQQQFFPQSQPQVQPQQSTPLPTPLFTRKFHLNNGYLFGRPTLRYDPKTNKMQPWVRKNLR